jgi:SRSO17 transposase
MKLSQFKSVERQLSDFVELFDSQLGRSERRYWCKMYLSGLLLDGERKSIEPLAARLPGGDKQALQQFVNQSPWDHEALQEALLKLMLKRRSCPGAVLVLDDTSLPKKGEMSVGVAPQYCGALGKVANCQSIVTWHYAGARCHFPLLAELFLPEKWIGESERLEIAGVPAQKRKFREKWKIALELLDRLRPQISYEAVVVDAGYGEIRPFLHELDKRKQVFVAQIPEHHGYWPAEVAVTEAANRRGRPRQFPEVADRSAQPLSARQWREQIEGSGQRWRTVRLKLKQKEKVQVVARRVRETTTQAWRRPGPERWLLIERLSDGTHKYYVSSAPEKTSVRQLVLWAHERWKVEQGYQQLKEELGLDHFEGRSWRGLHHHVTLCFAAYCFLKLVRAPKKNGGDVAAGKAVAERDFEHHPVSGVRGISRRKKSGDVRLNLT